MISCVGPATGQLQSIQRTTIWRDTETRASPPTAGRQGTDARGTRKAPGGALGDALPRPGGRKRRDGRASDSKVAGPRCQRAGIFLRHCGPSRPLPSLAVRPRLWFTSPRWPSPPLKLRPWPRISLPHAVPEAPRSRPPPGGDHQLPRRPGSRRPAGRSGRPRAGSPRRGGLPVTTCGRTIAPNSMPSPPLRTCRPRRPCLPTAFSTCFPASAVPRSRYPALPPLRLHRHGYGAGLGPTRS